MEKGDLVSVVMIDEIGVIDGGPYKGYNPDSDFWGIYYRVVWDEPPYDTYLDCYTMNRRVNFGEDVLTFVPDRAPVPPELW